METRDFFVTIKSGATNTTAGKQSESSSAAADRNKNKRDNRFTLGPLPLEIEDIHRVTIDVSEVQRWNSYQKIYGQKFKTVMFYGRCKPCGSSAAQKNRNVKLYEVDDGSGMVIVHFPHFDAEYSGKLRRSDMCMSSGRRLYSRRDKMELFVWLLRFIDIGGLLRTSEIQL